jgi:hypothetical protein
MARLTRLQRERDTFLLLQKDLDILLRLQKDLERMYPRVKQVVEVNQRLVASLERIQAIAYALDHPNDSTHLSPLEMGISKILEDAANTLHSLESSPLLEENASC